MWDRPTESELITNNATCVSFGCCLTILKSLTLARISYRLYFCTVPSGPQTEILSPVCNVLGLAVNYDHVNETKKPPTEVFKAVKTVDCVT